MGKHITCKKERKCLLNGPICTSIAAHSSGVWHMLDFTPRGLNIPLMETQGTAQPPKNLSPVVCLIGRRAHAVEGS
jgi:hypothetical protein